jgi:two-component system NtrC family sensor kinase
MDNSSGVKVPHRLHFKIALFVIVTIIIIFGLFTIYQIFSYRQELTAMEVQSSEELGRTLTSSLEIAMLNSDIESIQYSFNEVSRSGNIKSVFLLNMDGVIKASSQLEMIGRRMNREDDGCRNCHLTGKNLPASLNIPLENDEVLRVVTPVKNKPACHSCHGSEARLNGLLVLDRSLQPVKSEIISNLKLAGGIALALILIMMLLFRWYIKRQVLDRILYLENLARKVVGDELDVEIELKGQDELASLARSFDNMKNGLRLSMRKIENHRNYLAHLLENLIDGILIIDEGGRAAFINKSFNDILELDGENLKVGDSIDFDQRSLERFSPIGRLITEAKKQNSTIKETLKIKISEDSIKHLEIHVGRLILPPRLKPEVIVVVRDITARVMIESQVYKAEKLSTIGRLAAGIAHEINNPMASILTCAEGLLKTDSEIHDGGYEYLKIIRESAKRCKVITQKLLDYSAVSSMKKENVDLNEILQEAVSLLQFEANNKKVRIGISIPPELPGILGSRDSLIQVFVNLILNGIQSVGPDGVVNIEVEIDGDYIHIIVEDNGPGISEDNLTRVFDPFFTTKPVGIGTGLGLSVSQGIIKRHGGKIEIVRRSKELTSFVVSLPLDSRDEKIADGR